MLSGDVREPPREGTLLPETYKVVRGSSRSGLIRTMQDDQKKLLDQIWARRSPDLPFRTPYELVTLASIVEKETGKADERPHVASVFVNRLHKRMRLQSDPTIVYGLVGGKGTLGRGILRSEVDKPTPYNTYTIDGLPPGPIANPGRAALEAVANPIAHAATSISSPTAPAATSSPRRSPSMPRTSRAGARSRRTRPAAEVDRAAPLVPDQPSTPGRRRPPQPGPVGQQPAPKPGQRGALGDNLRIFGALQPLRLGAADRHRGAARLFAAKPAAADRAGKIPGRRAGGRGNDADQRARRARSCIRKRRARSPPSPTG